MDLESRALARGRDRGAALDLEAPAEGGGANQSGEWNGQEAVFQSDWSRRTHKHEGRPADVVDLWRLFLLVLGGSFAVESVLDGFCEVVLHLVLAAPVLVLLAGIVAPLLGLLPFLPLPLPGGGGLLALLTGLLLLQLLQEDRGRPGVARWLGRLTGLKIWEG